jgi:hypothetical protein
MQKAYNNAKENWILNTSFCIQNVKIGQLEWFGCCEQNKNMIMIGDK